MRARRFLDINININMLMTFETLGGDTRTAAERAWNIEGFVAGVFRALGEQKKTQASWLTLSKGVFEVGYKVLYEDAGREAYMHLRKSSSSFVSL